MTRNCFLTVCLVVVAAPALAQHPQHAAAAGSHAASSTKEQRIASAMSAAPMSITAHATIMDWGPTPDAAPVQLREGTNGWVCFPSTSVGPANAQDPMCLDKSWQGWAEALMARKDPPTGGSGVAYMLKGDKGASNTDPFATKATPDNAWVVSPAHVMVLVSDPHMLDSYPTDPKSGGPWVMWKGTAYAHLMVPVSPTGAAK